MPLLKLRQACIHPQVIRGKYVKFKHTMTMEELMMDMVAKAKVDLTNALRAVVSSLNGLAGINWINFEYSATIECYRSILQIAKDYEHVVKIDTLQMIHTLHNLAEALENHGAGVPHTLRDASLREEANALEDYYLKKTEEQVTLAKAHTIKLTDVVDEIAEGRPLGYSTWWEDLLGGLREDGRELLCRITTYLDDNKIPGQTSLSQRMRNLPATLRILAVWLADTDLAREEAMKSLAKLHNTPKEDLSYAAINCHLTKKRKQKNKKLCQLCMSGNDLKKYEALIFAIIEQNEEDEELYESDVEGDVNNRNKKLLSDLKDVEFYTIKKEGNWKPSPQEGVIRVLASYVKVKRLREDWIQDSTKHLLLLESVRKEFKSLRAEWQKISNLVAAKDEISMAKLRLRLPTEYELGEGSSSTAPKKQLEIVNVLQIHELPFHMTLLESELKSGQLDLKRTAGILLYLKNLQENGNTENEPCPVCQDKLDEKWSVLRCGHCLCFECIPTLLMMGSLGEVECPMCRLRTPKGEVSYVVANSRGDEEANNHKLVGSFSTKVEAVTVQLLKLRSSDPDVKVIIFSTWEKVLDVISEALKTNSISFRRLGSQSRHQNGLTQFKNGPVTALLIPLSRGSKGLNIIEATHVFLVEPILNPADELQAVGRVHRIGQTKPTFVHRFIIHNTVEEKMAISVDPDGWSDGNVTFAELFNLFKMETTKQPALNPVIIED
uniref:E3 ubiquitin-protein ligase SHPRH n=2 Tax=Lygus hesperus TaxID=30085 RepID=A0A0A9VZY3_LYGHE